MNELMSALLLLAIPLLPLLLAFPSLRPMLPKAQFIALLPAAIVVLTPSTFSVELPWLMFGSEMELDGLNRLLLGMSVIVWCVALIRISTETVEDNRSMTFLLLVMAGNFGAIVAADLLLFFSFTTLMGYALYALLVASGKQVRPVARAYLWLMIVADLLLFEVLLLVAVDNTNLDFASASTTMAQSPLLALNLWLVLSGFMLKAGILPFHFWLSSACRCVKPALTLLLTVAPLSVALLGLLRWLPLGEISLHVHGLIIQGIGVSPMLYALISVLLKSALKMERLAYGIIFMMGLFLTGVGTGLADAASWNRYETWGYYAVAAPGFIVLLLVLLSGTKPLLLDNTVEPALQTDDFTLRVERFAVMLVARVYKTGLHTLPQWRAWWLCRLSSIRLTVSRWHNVIERSEHTLRNWTIAITLLVLLGFIVIIVSVVN